MFQRCRSTAAVSPCNGCSLPLPQPHAYGLHVLNDCLCHHGKCAMLAVLHITIFLPAACRCKVASGAATASTSQPRLRPCAMLLTL